MTTILTFDQSRCRPVSAMHPDGKNLAGPAKVLMFTGVRRESLLETLAPYAPRHPEPMFNDPAPDKPGGTKPRRGKIG